MGKRRGIKSVQMGVKIKRGGWHFLIKWFRAGGGVGYGIANTQ